MKKTVKNLIYEAYNWCKDQLINLLENNSTTDLWTSKSNYRYNAYFVNFYHWISIFQWKCYI